MFGFGWLFGRRRQSREYLHDGRLEDVIALIQVLGLGGHTIRGERAIQEVLGDKPASGPSWCAVAKEHPEFFRCFKRPTEDSTALIARHLTGKDEDGPVLKPEYIHGLVEAAIRIHQGQLQRRQVLRIAWAAAAITALPGIIVVFLNKYLPS